MRPFRTLFPRIVMILLLSAGCEPGDTAETEAMPPAISEPDFEFSGTFRGPLGLQLWSVRDAMDQDLEGTLAWVREMGFREVETAGTHGRSAQEFRRLLDEADLRATAVHTGYERLRDSLQVVLAEADTLGTRYVGTAWIPHPEDRPFGLELPREAAAHFNEWGAAASERGLRFFYHVHGYEFEPAADGSIPFDVLVTETDPEHVYFEMDVFWVAHPGVDPVELLHKYPDRWVLMHVKDLREGTPSDFSGHAPAEANVAVGQGRIDYPAVLRVAAELGVEHYYIEDETTDPKANIPISIRYMETVQF